MASIIYGHFMPNSNGATPSSLIDHLRTYMFTCNMQKNEIIDLNQVNFGHKINNDKSASIAATQDTVSQWCIAQWINLWIIEAAFVTSSEIAMVEHVGFWIYVMTSAPFILILVYLDSLIISLFSIILSGLYS